MGQNESSGRTTATNFTDFKKDVAKANEIASGFQDPKGRVLTFEVVPEEEEKILFPMFWKQVVTVHVRKKPLMSPTGGKILKYKQFYAFFNHMQMFNASPKKPSLKEIPTQTLTSGGDDSEEETECIICMEKRAEVVLPCTHKFCQKCLDSWSEKSETCPMCRCLTTDHSDQFWIVDDTNDEQVNNYLVHFLEQICEK